jgi:hypothetical protein
VVLENWTSICRRLKINLHLSPCTKINPKWIKDLNVRPNIKKLQEGNIGKTFQDNGRQGFSEQETKTKIDKWNCKLKELLHSKGKNQQSKETAYRIGENIF